MLRNQGVLRFNFYGRKAKSKSKGLQRVFVRMLTLIMYEKIKRFRQEHRSVRWIARNSDLDFRTVWKYLEMDQLDFER